MIRTKRVLTDVRMEIDPPSYLTYYWRDPLQKARAMESWAEEFHDFLRDHRSQDPVYINVIRVYEEVCVHCGVDPEPDERGCPCCCGKAVEEWESEQEAVGDIT